MENEQISKLKIQQTFAPSAASSAYDWVAPQTAAESAPCAGPAAAAAAVAPRTGDPRTHGSRDSTLAGVGNAWEPMFANSINMF